MSNETMLDLYESVAVITSRMLDAAKNEDWDLLAEMEQQCLAYMRQMETIDKSKPLSPTALKRKLDSINKILADDREIRDLTEPWMKQLTGMLHPSGGRSALSS